jgi:hypothetical protein
VTSPHPSLRAQRSNPASLSSAQGARALAATFTLPFANGGSSDHKHVKDDHGRETSDHRPDTERPKDVFGAEALLVG